MLILLHFLLILFALILTYTGKEGNRLITKMKKHIKKTLPENVKTIVAYESKKLSSRFPTKDITKFHHQNNFTINTMANVQMKHVQMIILAKVIGELKKE